MKNGRPGRPFGFCGEGGSGLGAGQPGAMRDSGKRTADQRRDDEEPQLRERRAADEERRPDRTRGVHRNAGDVDADQVDAGEGEADGKAGKARRRTGAGHAEDHGDEEEGRHRFKDQRSAHRIAAIVAGAETILAKPIRRDRVIGLAGGDHIDREGADDRAENLCDDIGQELGRAHPAGEQHTERDRGVEMRARDRTKPVGCGDDRQAEGDRDALHADMAAHQHRRAHAEEHQDEGAEKFCRCFLHGIICPFTFHQTAAGRAARPHTGAEYGGIRGLC
ncbi:hypothetical protein SDC9_39023 [bioreactor metagenome]|uniref:Uncharacterized protein n=1 Tax=bioreactor metagenome TaxID=1076179 RepID=A0A644VNB2_9ZZZZ